MDYVASSFYFHGKRKAKTSFDKNNLNFNISEKQVTLEFGRQLLFY